MSEINSLSKKYCSDPATEKFFKHLVTHLKLDSSQANDPRELLAAILNAPKLSLGTQNDLSSQQIKEAAIEVAEKLIDELDLQALEKMAICLAAQKGQNDLIVVLDKYRKACNAVLEIGRQKISLMRRPQWFQDSVTSCLRSELVERISDKEFIKEITKLLFEANHPAPADQSKFNSFAKKISSSLVDNKNMSSLDKQISELLKKADEDFLIFQRLIGLVPWVQFASSAVVAAFCAETAQACVAKIIKFQCQSNSPIQQRPQSMAEATDLLIEQLSKEDAAKLVARYAERIFEKSSDSPHSAIKFVELIENNLPEEKELLSKVRKSAVNIGNISLNLAKFSVLALGGAVVFTAMSAVAVVGAVRYSKELSQKNQSRIPDYPNAVEKEVDLNESDDTNKRFDDEHVSNFKRWDRKERELEVIRRYRKDEDAWYEMLKKLAVKELSRSVVAIAEAKKKHQPEHADAEEGYDLELTSKIVRTKELLVQILNPSIDAGLLSLFSQKHFIHNMEMRPPSLLQICDLLGKNSPARKDANFKLN